MPTDTIQERQRRTVDQVDVFLECSGLPTYSEIRKQNSELLVAIQFDVAILQRRHDEAMAILRTLTQPNLTHLQDVIEQAAEIVAKYDAIQPTNEEK